MMTESAVIHFWHPDLLHEVHPGSGEGGETCSDDLRRVNCDTCREVLIAAVRALRNPPADEHQHEWVQQIGPGMTSRHVCSICRVVSSPGTTAAGS